MSNELTTTSILSLFQTTKEQRESFAIDLIERIESGSVNPLEIHLQVKCMDDVVKLINSNTVYKKSILSSAENMGEKSFQFHNAKFEIKETGVKYDFSRCEDPLLSRLYTQQSELDGKVKDRESMLKTVPQKGMIVTDEETGETFTVYPPSKSSTTNVSVTLK